MTLLLRKTVFANSLQCVDGYLRLSRPSEPSIVPVVDVVVVVPAVLIVGMTVADSFSFSFSLSALSSAQYLVHIHVSLTKSGQSVYFDCQSETVFVPGQQATMSCG